MSCERYHPAIEAYVDNECDADEAGALREHLRACPDCRRRAVQLSALQELVNRELSAEAAPPDLWHRIAAGLDQAEVAPTATPLPAPVATPRRAPWSNIRRLMAAAAIVTVVAGGLTLALQPAVRSEQAVVQETVEDLATFELSRRPFDIAASDPAIVRAWFAGKVRFEVPPIKASAAGYELIGSRLCWLLGRRGGAFTYQHGERLMTLYVIQDNAIELSASQYDPVLGTAAVRHLLANYASLIWRQGGLVFSLVSDAPDEEMTAFAATVIDHGEGAALQLHDVLLAQLSLAQAAGGTSPTRMRQ